MRILLLSNQHADQDFFGKAAAVTAIPLQVMASAEALCVAVAKGVPFIAVIDASTQALYQTFEKALSDKVGLFSELINPNFFFFVTPEALTDASYLINSGVFGHYIQRNYSKDTDHLLVGKLFRVALSGTPLEGASGLERFFEPGVKMQTIELKRSTQKIAIVDALKGELIKNGFSSRIATSMVTALDELLMNAIFDAPIDQTGKYLYTQTPRNTELELSGKNAVELKMAFDGKILGASIRDQYGSVDKKKMIGHLGKSYREEEFKVRMNVAGAGIGLGNVLRGSGGMIFECDTGVSTLVSIFFSKTESFKEFKDQFRFLSTFMYFS